MKYYLYISDAKVDMLFPQVPHDIKSKVAHEYKFDVKLFSASRKTETESEENRIARLEAVVDFIRDYGKLGTADHPDDFIADSLAMRWGPYSNEAAREIVLFEGNTADTVVVLGGSSRHVVGNAGQSLATSSSSTPALIRYLTERAASDEMSGSGASGDEMIRAAILAARTTQRPYEPLQNVEFVAKRLLYWKGENLPNPVSRDGKFVNSRKFNALLASPLYVAMTD
jgi:hypothetical protein